jgi:hypothetical protein
LAQDRRGERVGRAGGWSLSGRCLYERQGWEDWTPLSLSLCLCRKACLTHFPSSFVCDCGVVRKDAGQFGLRLENEGPEASRIQVHIKNSH